MELINDILIFGVISLYITTTSACPTDCYCILSRVDCSGVELREIPTGIPSQTTTLNLQDNQIEYVSKSSLQHLSNLRELVLKSNKIVGIEEGSFDKLFNLLSLNIGSNRITELTPGLLSNLTKLNDLYLNHNFLQNIDGVLNNLHKLHRVDLSFNQIKQLTENSLGGAADLRYLMIPDNDISFISPNAFTNLRNLSYISLRHNPLTNADGLFTSNKFLNFIELSECKLSTFPQDLPKTIQYLHLRQNNISRITKPEVAPYTKMVILILDENQLSFIENAAFSDMESLSELWMNMNKLKQIPTKLPRKLKILQITGNEIAEIKNSDFPSGAELELLSLQSNNIQVINQKMFKNIPNLNRLYLGGNLFTVLKDYTFSNLNNLEFLSLSTIDLDYIGEHVFSGLENLSELEMQFIQTTESAIQGNIFQHLRNLGSLDIQESKAIAHQLLSSEHMMKSLSSLSELNIMDNGITTLDAKFMQLLPHITIIKMHGNEFHCDKRLVWFRNWINLESDKFFLAHQIQCNTPQSLRGTSLMDVPVAQFIPTTEHATSIILSTSPRTPEAIFVQTSKKSVTTRKQISTIHADIRSENVSKNVENFINSSEKDITTHNFISNDEDLENRKKEHMRQQHNGDTNKFSDAGIIATSAAITVVLICIILGIVLFILCKKRENLIFHRAFKYEGENEVFTVSMVSSEEAIQGPPPGKRTREDRGSVTSKPGEDITNDIERKMKVYTLDDNKN